MAPERPALSQSQTEEAAMAINSRKLRFFGAAALVAAATASQPARAGEADHPGGFCPVGYKLWGALCMSATSGDVVKPQTSGPAYEMRKSRTDIGILCTEWDIHISTQIGDFGTAGTIPTNHLEKAALLHNVARTLCFEGRFAEGVNVYEAIFIGLE
jgi:hypothetical protein